MLFKIQNAFDSHCHFLASGQVASGLSLKNLKSPEELKDLKIESHHYQGEWLVGFGWDQNNWPASQFPDAKVLDTYFPNKPVFFSRVDGHSSWVNTLGLQKLAQAGYNFAVDISGGKVARDPQGNPTGILFDQAHINALILLPQFSTSQIRQFLHTSQKLFNQGGFTHVRDLSMTANTWNHLAQMAENKELTVCIEGFVTVENLMDLPRVVDEVRELQSLPNPFLRIRGIKLFLDGSLGSMTAFLSQNYLQQSNHGLLCWDLYEVELALKTTWQNGFDFAVHAIGDEAVHNMVQLARKVSAEGILGRLHLEHVQIIRPETIQLMKPLHVTCHMQPCHWLSDHKWLKTILPESLIKNSFRWESLRKNKINLQLGSDSPIEPTSLIQSYQALQQSAKLGWAEPLKDWTHFHSHPDKKWIPSVTCFTENKISQVYFNGDPLF